MGCLRFESPALLTDCLDMAGPWSVTRKVFLWQHQNGDSISIFDDDGLLAMAFLVSRGDGTWEFALALRARARERMLELCRFAHLTLARLADTGAVIICHVMDGNKTGSRMARLVGFAPAGGTLWKWSGKHDKRGEGSVRGQAGRYGEEEPTAPAGGERPAIAIVEHQ
ncbi:hypothetical protein RvVAT039_02230 [Agrobacterium vitis]|nr:hypothetical protein RvVAT039_02230 [Agrobacterium vitis]